MREFKFRAWDNGVMIPPFHLGSVNTQIYGGRGRPETIIMQYTGLKDRTGREIYEGDIIQQRDKFDIVEWFAGYEGDGFVCSGFVLGYREFDQIATIEKPDYEIIGNIYENPDLAESLSSK